MTTPTLAIEHLTIRGPRGEVLVNDLSFTIGAQRIVALVGESGSGSRSPGARCWGCFPTGSPRRAASNCPAIR